MILSFEKRFLTEEERYAKYIWLLKLSIIAQICAYLAYLSLDTAAVNIMQAVRIVLWLLINIIVLQVAWQSRAIHFIIRLWLCAAGSVAITVVLVPFFGFLPVALGAIITIFANRKQLKIFLRYKDFLKYFAAWLGLSMLVLVAGHMKVFGLDPATLSLIRHLLLFYVLWRLLRHECEQGRPFRETIRILLLMPLIGMFLLIGWLSILPLGPMSGKKLFGEEGHDFLALER